MSNVKYLQEVCEQMKVAMLYCPTCSFSGSFQPLLILDWKGDHYMLCPHCDATISLELTRRN